MLTTLARKSNRKKAAPMNELKNLKNLRKELFKLAGHYLREAIEAEDIDRKTILTQLSAETLSEAGVIAHSICDMEKAYDIR